MIFDSPFVPEPPFSGTVWSELHAVSEEDTKKILEHITVKTCDLVPLPASLLPGCLKDLLPHFTSIINNSLSSGSFLGLFKYAVVKPLLKKSTLDPKILKNYRPVFNLSFLSEVFKRIILLQLSDHLQANNLLYPNQSAYRASHSIETAILNIVNDLLSVQDNNKPLLLSLPDLSATFDTTDHSILSSHLNTSFGLSSSLLSWFYHYLSNHTQIGSISGSKSLPALQFSVPHESVLRTIIFILCIQPLSAIVNLHSGVLSFNSFITASLMIISLMLSEHHEQESCCLLMICVK